MQKEIGANVRSARIRMGLTQAELAELIGASVSYMSKIERGAAIPSMKMILSLCEKLHTSYESLILGHPNDTEEALEVDFLELQKILRSCSKEAREMLLSIARELEKYDSNVRYKRQRVVSNRNQNQDGDK